MAIKICLDAGHYGKYNRSPAVKTYYESDMNWKLHLLLKKYLEQYGFEVSQTRSCQEKDLGLVARGKKSKGCDLFLSIHSNAAGSYVNEAVDYPVVYVPLNGTGDKIGRMLADCIKEVMDTKQKAYVKTREGKNGDYYSVIWGAVSVGVPGLILEHSFHTNTRATKWLLDDRNLDTLARAEAAVIAEYFGAETPENGETSGEANTAEKTEEKTETTNEGEKTVNIEMTVLKRGMKGEQVKTLQRLLPSLGFKMKSDGGRVYGVDGSFGGATENAVRAFQADRKIGVDGIVWPETWTKLLKG